MKDGCKEKNFLLPLTPDQTQILNSLVSVTFVFCNIHEAIAEFQAHLGELLSSENLLTEAVINKCFK